MSIISTKPAFDFALFDNCMAVAIEGAQVGFFFEEGGCWGMAHALYERLQKDGHQPVLMYRDSGFVHAWIALDGIALDWRGVFRPAPGGLVLPGLPDLIAVAKIFGAHGEDYLADVARAEEVLNALFDAMATPA